MGRGPAKNTAEKHVTVDGKRYVVRLDERGPYVVYERKIYAKGKPYESLYNQPRWSLASTGVLPTRGKIHRVLLAALRK